MLSRVLVLLFILFVDIGMLNADPSHKILTMKKVGAITSHLVEVSELRVKDAAAGNDVSNRKLQSDITHILADESDLDALVQVAKISLLYMEPGRAEDQIIDNVFDEAWRVSIKRIEGIGGDAAINALESINRQRPLDGAFSYFLAEALQRLKEQQER